MLAGRIAELQYLEQYYEKAGVPDSCCIWTKAYRKNCPFKRIFERKTEPLLSRKALFGAGAVVSMGDAAFERRHGNKRIS